MLSIFLEFFPGFQANHRSFSAIYPHFLPVDASISPDFNINDSITLPLHFKTVAWMGLPYIDLLMSMLGLYLIPSNFA